MEKESQQKELPRPAIVVCCKPIRLLLLMVVSLGLFFAGDYQNVLVMKYSPVVEQPDTFLEEIPEPAQAREERAPEPAVAEEVPAFDCKRQDSFDDIIEEAAVRYNVEAALVKAIIMAESGYDPRAVSSRGAMGLMQLMPGTAESLGVKDGFNPEENIDAGVRYFRNLMNNFGEETRLALAAYNAGPRKVREYSGVPPFPATRVYIEKVFRYYRYFKDSPGGSMENV
ncbi:MAG: hypothetical protein AVO39_00785 [delta proteobacterium MLS_D]|jgi:soluble lytic murein transglycosylase-like protein|nr:MAG: hypothetical protein AVO39_00785 [delta proteobacterium MLS_D]